MNSYYEDQEAWDGKGVDYDLLACLAENPQEGWEPEDIAVVMAVVEGERDEQGWSWVLFLTDGRYVHLTGGCDYTGWDCQSWARSTFWPDAVAACRAEEDKSVAQELWRQVLDGRNPTKREAVQASMAKGSDN